MKRIIFLLSLITLLSDNIIGQEIPTTINYQGVLKDVDGGIVTNGEYIITFKFYNAESGGSELWSEMKPINVVDGIIGTQLGSATPIPLPIFFESVWLGVTVGGESELIPRVALTSVPYSFMSMNVPDSSINSAKIRTGEVVKSINGLTDSITLVAGSNITITPSGNDLTISSSGGGTGTIGGSGTSNYLTRFSGETTIANSIIYQTGGNLGIGTTAPTVKLELAGSDAKIYGLTVGRGGGSIGSNVALGIESLKSNTTGIENTAIGLQAIYNNTGGSNNTAIGNNSLYHNTLGEGNTAIGDGTLYHNVRNIYNTAIGFQAMYNASSSYDPDASYNTAVGSYALLGSNVPANNSPMFNTAIGYYSLYSNTTGDRNTGIGTSSLHSNTGGERNLAAGMESLHSNTTGTENTAVGYRSLFTSTTSNNNTAVGSSSLYSNTTGSANTANGKSALYTNTTGTGNTADGVTALFSNSHGWSNTAVGGAALYSNTTGNENTAIGSDALYLISTQSSNTALGYFAGGYRTFSTSTFLGANSEPNNNGYSNVMALGYDTRPTASNQVRIGNTSITSIGGYAGWTNFSDGRYKLAVNESVKGLEFIMKLRPITYQLDMNRLSAELKENQRRDENGNVTTTPTEQDIKSRNEKSQIVYTGFVAQEVEKAAKDLGFNFSGIDVPKNENDFYGLRYAEFVVPLVKAVQEQQKTIEALERRIEELERR